MRCVFPIESRDKCPSSSLQHGEARERNAVAVAHREGPPGHRCHGAARTSPTFATVASNSLPARRAHSNAPAAPADCQCYPGRRASEPGRWSAARTAPSSSASPAATSTAQGSRVGGLPPSCRATPHPRHPASGSQLRGCAKPYQNWHGSRAAREPRRSLQRLQRQRAYAHATKQLTRGVSSINRTRRAAAAER